MNLQLNSKQVLALYQLLKDHVDYDVSDPDKFDALDSIRSSIEDFIIVALERVEAEANTNKFSKWVATEKTKINKLEEELKEITASAVKMMPQKNKKLKNKKY